MLLPDDRRPKDRLLSPSRFCPYSLGDWIGACERAEIPHVPAMHVTDFERYDLLQHEEAGPHQETARRRVRVRAPRHVPQLDAPLGLLRQRGPEVLDERGTQA